jgi:hypothetical protein
MTNNDYGSPKFRLDIPARERDIKPMKRASFLAFLLLAACGTTRHPTVGGDPSTMSADTLCYRYAYAKSNEALKAEIDARNLDCEDVLAAQPAAMSGSAVGESRW